MSLLDLLFRKRLFRKRPITVKELEILNRNGRPVPRDTVLPEGWGLIAFNIPIRLTTPPPPRDHSAYLQTWRLRLALEAEEYKAALFNGRWVGPPGQLEAEYNCTQCEALAGRWCLSDKKPFLHYGRHRNDMVARAAAKFNLKQISDDEFERIAKEAKAK